MTATYIVWTSLDTFAHILGWLCIVAFLGVLWLKWAEDRAHARRARSVNRWVGRP